MNQLLFASLCCFAMINASSLEDRVDEPQDRGHCRFEGYRYWRGNCYMFVESFRTRSRAVEYCRDSSAARATLASIGSRAENDFIYSLFNYKNGLNAWIGGTLDRTNEWAWADGNFWNPNGYDNWDRGEPNNWRGNNKLKLVAEDKIFMYGRTGRGPAGTWNDDGNTNSGYKALDCQRTESLDMCANTGLEMLYLFCNYFELA